MTTLDQPTEDRIPSRAAYGIVYFVGRIAQLIGLALFALGCSFVPELMQQYQEWEKHTIDLRSLAFTWVKVAAPVAVGVLIVASAQARLSVIQRYRRQWSTLASEPWRAVPQWQSDRIETQSLGPIVIRTAAVLYILVGLPLIFSSGWIGNLWLLVLTAYLALMFAYNYGKYMPWWKSEFELISVPGIVGGSFSGIFHIEKSLPNEIFEVILECTQTESDASDSDSIPRTRVLWFKTIEVLSDSDNAQWATTVPIEFDIPVGLPSSQLPLDRPSEQGNVKWQLKVKPKSKQDRAAIFDVPVFANATGSPKIKSHENKKRSFKVRRQDPDIAALLERDGFDVVEDHNGGLVFELRRKRDHLRSGALSLAVIMLGAIAAIFWGISSLIIAMLVSLIPVGLLGVVGWYLLESYFWKATVRRGKDNIQITQSLGLWSRASTFPIATSTKLYCYMISKTESSSFWDVYITGESNKSVALWRSFSSSEAESLGGWFAKELGVRFEKPDTRQY